VYVEGEKDADTLAALRFTATTNAGGCAWRLTPEFVDYFAGAKRVVVVVDSDAPGRKAGRERAAMLREVVDDVRVLDLAPERDDGYDVSDWFADGHSRAELISLILAATPIERAIPAVAAPTIEIKWPEIKEVGSGALAVPPMPAEMIPAPLRAALLDAAQRMCVPLEMLAAPAIVALGSIIGRSVAIRPKRHDDWEVVPNLWGAIVAPPGMMKTPIRDEALRPLKRLARTARERFEVASGESEGRRSALELEIAGLEHRARDLGKKADVPTALLCELQAKKIELADARVVERRYDTQDATVEKLGLLLKDNPRGILLDRDELAGWLESLDKQGREGDRAFYLESWNGTGAFTVDRIGRGTIHVPALCVSIFGTIQPGRLLKYVGEAVSVGRGADGLLQRFQVVIFPDAFPDYENVDRYPDTTAKNRAFAISKSLDELRPATVGALADPETDSIPTMRFDDAGQQIFNEWRDELERRLREPALRSQPALESHLSKYRKAMPALALI
ncbi:MAG: DUF3987 domain-containing protein, partial [Vulcanimicrobiaceae bacterium]